MEVDTEGKHEEGETLFSFRAHAGWVSQLQFLSTVEALLHYALFETMNSLITPYDIVICYTL